MSKLPTTGSLHSKIWNERSENGFNIGPLKVSRLRPIPQPTTRGRSRSFGSSFSHFEELIRRPPLKTAFLCNSFFTASRPSKRKIMNFIVEISLTEQTLYRTPFRSLLSCCDILMFETLWYCFDELRHSRHTSSIIQSNHNNFKMSYWCKGSLWFSWTV